MLLRNYSFSEFFTWEKPGLYLFSSFSFPWDSLSWCNRPSCFCQMGTTELGIIIALRDDGSICHFLFLRHFFLRTGYFCTFYSTTTGMWLRKEILQILISFFRLSYVTAMLCSCKHFQVPFRSFPSSQRLDLELAYRFIKSTAPEPPLCIDHNFPCVLARCLILI